MTGRFLVSKTGDPQVMQWVEEALPPPGPGEVQVRHEAIGVDFIDTQIRGGLLPFALPTGLGFGGAGVIEAVGAEVRNLAAGDRIAYTSLTPGSYSLARNLPAERIFRLPDQSLPADLAAAALFRGLTAWYLATRLRKIEPGDPVLVHAAAGGVGLILIQWLAHLGATVIGTVGHPEKVAALRDYGCAHPIPLGEDLVGRVKEITQGKGCAVVYDSVGRATFDRSLQCARRFGLVVSYGWSSGDVEPVALMTLRNGGSLFVTRPTVSHYTAEASAFQAGAAALFGLIGEGWLRIKVGHAYPLRDAARAHADLAGGRTTGSIILRP
ncbi:quinone oxidoreductase family protein [Hypericibacter adhaerens]|nr:quinone oxidoreductase [Hypericibacter adhaerens]